MIRTRRESGHHSMIMCGIKCACVCVGGGEEEERKMV